MMIPTTKKGKKLKKAAAACSCPKVRIWILRELFAATIAEFKVFRNGSSTIGAEVMIGAIYLLRGVLLITETLV